MESHFSLVGFHLVFVANQMQMSVGYYPNQLIEKQCVMGFCVVTNAVNREKEVTAYLIAIRIIESDNVREVVVR